MIVTTTAHIGDTPVKAVLRKEQYEERQYIVLNIGGSKLALFIDNREKALEIASQLEKAAQQWEGES